MPALYVVATPIGNLGEMSPRAVETLRGANLILAEDTRVTRKLLAHFDIHVPLQSNHRHNEREQAEALVRRMLAEKLTVALVSDAGTPGVSDPGAALVSLAWEAGIPVRPVAGPSAVAAALSISGFPGTVYAFYGFPPRAQGERRRFLADLPAGPSVAILFESPHRVIALIKDIADALPGARACLCCDLTKRYELTVRGTPGRVLDELEANPNAERGEYVLALDLSACPKPEREQPPLSARAFLLDALADGLSMKDALALAADKGIARNEAYRASLEVKAFLEGRFG